MCIRDRLDIDDRGNCFVAAEGKLAIVGIRENRESWQHLNFCLLYTSDAADERSSVDLGGRRIIKKKNNVTIGEST